MIIINENSVNPRYILRWTLHDSYENKDIFYEQRYSDDIYGYKAVKGDIKFYKTKQAITELSFDTILERYDNGKIKRVLTKKIK